MVGLRECILAVLAERPSYGNQVKAELESRTAQLWHINAGQIYSTLTRAVRDGLVTEEPADAQGKIRYVVTPHGRHVVAEWFLEPVNTTEASSNSLPIKATLAVGLPSAPGEVMLLTQIEFHKKLLATISATADTNSPLFVTALQVQLSAELDWMNDALSEVRLAMAIGEPLASPLNDTEPARGRPAKHS